MKTVTLLFLFAIGLLSCDHLRGPADGGPCTYNITKLPATVIAVYPRSAEDSSYFEVLFRVEKNGTADTLFYTRNFPGYASAEEVSKYDLHVGTVFVYEHQQIVNGSCTPDLWMLKLEKYQ